jgi:hypothetical protein
MQHQIRFSRSDCMWFAYVYLPRSQVALDTVARATYGEGREIAFQRACHMVDRFRQ